MNRHSPEIVICCVVLVGGVWLQQFVLGLELELCSKGILPLHHPVLGKHLQEWLKVQRDLKGDL